MLTWTFLPASIFSARPVTLMLGRDRSLSQTSISVQPIAPRSPVS
jgi:hypothetical protein